MAFVSKVSFVWMLLIVLTVIQTVHCGKLVLKWSEAMRRPKTAIAANSDTFELAVNFLSRYGYLAKSDMASVNLRSEDQLRVAIAKMQTFAHLEPTGVIDNATLVLMKRKRCGVPDLSDSSIDRVKRYALQGAKWQKSDLTWSVKHWSQDIDSNYVLSELRKAFKVWSNVSKLTFTETRDPDADIVISFLKGWHGDEYPFDGRGAILAHAFFPGSGIGGDTHFDADERWSQNSYNQLDDDNDANNWGGVSLFAVAAHEFGHSLGLSHSSVAGSLMFPYYQNIEDDFKLPYDDTIGIQQLYGAKTSTKWAPMPPVATQIPDRAFDRPTISGSIPVIPVKPKTTLRPSIPKLTPKFPNFCNSNFDAIALIRRDIFVFKGKYFWWLRENKTFERPEANLIFQYWKGLPVNIEKVDAVYERPKDKKIVFFIGKKYWLFTNNNAESGYPRLLTHLGLPHNLEKIDAAMIWGHNGKTYLFSGHLYWRYEEDDNRVDLDYPRDMSVWSGVPYNIDAAFQWSFDGQSYFFKGLKFWKFDNRKMRISDDSPQLSSQFWFESVCKSKHDPSKAKVANHPSNDPSINSSITHKTNFRVYIIILNNVLLFYNFYIQNKFK